MKWMRLLGENQDETNPSYQIRVVESGNDRLSGHDKITKISGDIGPPIPKPVHGNSYYAGTGVEQVLALLAALCSHSPQLL